MEPELFVKYIKFLNNEAKRYLSDGRITKDQVIYFNREIDNFKLKIQDKTVPMILFNMVNRLSLDIKMRHVEGSRSNTLKTILKGRNIFAINRQIEKDQEQIRLALTDFTDQLSAILFEYDRIKDSYV